jgi:hypothetical protein
MGTPLLEDSVKDRDGNLYIKATAAQLACGTEQQGTPHY